MAIVSFNGTSYECDKAIKGSDYIHLLDSAGTLIAAFEQITNFSVFTISSGSWTSAQDADECNLVTMGEDGVLRKGSHKCSDITPITYGTADLTAGSSTLATGALYFVYE